MSELTAVVSKPERKLELWASDDEFRVVDDPQLCIGWQLCAVLWKDAVMSVQEQVANPDPNTFSYNHTIWVSRHYVETRPVFLMKRSSLSKVEELVAEISDLRLARDKQIEDYSVCKKVLDTAQTVNRELNVRIDDLNAKLAARSKEEALDRAILNNLESCLGKLRSELGQERMREILGESL
jgi:hypothetical protein